MTKSDNTHQPVCGKCRAPLSEHAPEGLCAVCLLESAYAVPDSAEDLTVPALSEFGDFELLQEIARGGMGIVYRARQISLNRIVAVKMILAGRFASAAESARFRAEAETAAQLQHPGIVAIHEIGDHEGCLYFSMDYVAGTTLGDLVREHPLPAYRAARYARAIAEAVHHAHHKGVLHRDLKPSNVLVDEQDQPRVTDFGLAKWLEGKSDLTQTGQIIGSPNFMSPEQARGRNVGPESDVYSLGAVLYYLLTCRAPFSAENVNETLRMLAEDEPVSPKMMNAAVPRDLETICLKCLEKEPRRRYATARDLAEDLNRFLSNQAVLARPPSTIYRLERLVRRNKIVFGAAGAIWIALAVGLAVSISQYYKKRAALEEAIVAKREAEARTEDAKAVIRFLREKVLAAARPEGHEGGLGKDVTLRRAVEAAESQIALLFTNRPLVEAEIRDALGNTFFYLSDYREAIERAERCVAVAETHLKPNAPERLRYLNNLALDYRAGGMIDKAIPIYEQLLEIRKATLGLTNRNTIGSLGNLGAAYAEVDRLQDAINLLEQAVELANAYLTNGDYYRIVSLQDLARAYRQTGKVKESLPMFESALRQAETQFGADNPETFSYINDVAGSYWMLHQLPDAIKLFERVLALTEAKLDPDSDKTLAAMANLASAYRDSGRLEEAIQLNEKAFERSKARLTLDHPYTLMFMNNLAIAYQRNNRLDQALPLWEETLRLQRTKFGNDASHTLETMNNLAGAFRSADRLEESLELSKEALELSLTKLGAEHPITLGCMGTRASALKDAGQITAAVPLYEKQLHGSLIRLPPEHPDVLLARGNLGLAFSELGRNEEAVSVLTENLRLVRESKGSAHPSTLLEMGRLAVVYIDVNRWAEARELLEPLLKAQSSRPAEEKAPVAETELLLARCLMEQHEAGAAEKLLKQCLDRFAATAHTTTFERAKLLLGRAMLLQKQYAGAEPLLLQGYEALSTVKKVTQLARNKRLLDQAKLWIIQLYTDWYEAEPDPAKAAKATEWKAG